MQGSTERAGAFNRLVAAVLTFAVAGYWIPAGAFAAVDRPEIAGIRGHVVGADGLTAVAGVSVKAANMESKTVFSSAPTGKDGVYTLKDLPPGTYDLAIETPEGLFAADSLIDTTKGKWTIVSLALGVKSRSASAEDPPKPGEGGDQPADPNAPPKPEQGGEKPADPNAPKQEPQAGGEEPKKGETPPEPQPQDQQKKKKGASFWRSPTGAIIAIVTGAILIGAAASSASSNDSGDNESMTKSN